MRASGRPTKIYAVFVLLGGGVRWISPVGCGRVRLLAVLFKEPAAMKGCQVLDA